jgi:hypothetical protein
MSPAAKPSCFKLNGTVSFPRAKYESKEQIQMLALRGGTIRPKKIQKGLA